VQGAFGFDQPIFLGNPKEVASILVGFNAIPIAVEKLDVSVRSFSCRCCYCISMRGSSSREGARVPLCSTSNRGREVRRVSRGDICGGFSCVEGNFDVMIIQREKLELCYDPVWDHQCDSTYQHTRVWGQGFQGKTAFHAWRSGVEKSGEDFKFVRNVQD
jgi:hypothetical protein